jgi:hydrogenase nickel incorporation protein HypA/HybF
MRCLFVPTIAGADFAEAVHDLAGVDDIRRTTENLGSRRAFSSLLAGCATIHKHFNPGDRRAACCGMHELSLVESIKDLALRHARAGGGLRVLSIRITIGDLASYLEEALATYWTEISAGSDVAGARLDFVRIPGELLCISCAKRFPASRLDCPCPFCGSEWVKATNGADCYVESIEVETSA